MNCQLSQVLKLNNSPVVFILANEKPEEALEAREGIWCCVAAFYKSVTKGKTAVFSRKTTGCLGGQVGLGFGNAYEGFPGGIEHFLSTGKEGFREGEGYLKTPEHAMAFVNSLPITDIPYDYVVMKPLEQVDLEKETPVLVSFYVNVDQLSALTVLANYEAKGEDRVRIPFGAGCQTLFLMPYHESRKERPRAIVGLLDVTVRPMVDKDHLAFTVPFQFFREMEANIPGSFLEKKDWQKIQQRMDKQ